MNILDLTWPQFLGVYILGVSVAVVLGLVLRKALRGPAGVPPVEASRLHPLEIACLAGGARLAVNTAIASLYRRDAIRLGSKTRALEPFKPLEGDVHPLEESIYR